MWHDADDAFCCEVCEMRAGCRACLWRKHVTGRAARVVSSSRSSVVPCVLRVLHRPCLSSPCRSVAVLHGCVYRRPAWLQVCSLFGFGVDSARPVCRWLRPAPARCRESTKRGGAPAVCATSTAHWCPGAPFRAVSRFFSLGGALSYRMCVSALDALLGAMTVLSRERKRVTRSKKTDLFAATTLFETPRGKSLN